MEQAPHDFSVHFHGGADEVTGSRHLVQFGDERVMLDCGLFQGHRLEALEKTKTFPADPASVTAVVLSHAHIDHSGGLPLLVKKGFAGRIHCTAVTAELLPIMLMDSAILQEEDAKFYNKIHAAEGLTIEPLYTQEDAEAALRLIVPHPYDETFMLAQGFDVSFHNAGHVLGSAMVRLGLRTMKRKRYLVFTGDLGRHETILLNPPQVPPHVDFLLIESTYGGRRHADIKEAEDFLADVINRSERENGPILIPSFALERTQEVVFLLEKLLREKRIKPIHIYVDSPMAVNITEIFQKHIADPSMSDAFRRFTAKDDDPFGMKSIRYVKSVEDSKRLTNTPGRKIIMAGSGMCEGGRILHHLRNLVDDPSTTILLVGYQAHGTLGRRLSEGIKKVKIFGLAHDVAAEVLQMNHFSAHADQDDLVRFIRALSPRPEMVFLVHGDREQREALTEKLKAEGITRVTLPRFGEKFTLD